MLILANVLGYIYEKRRFIMITLTIIAALIFAILIARWLFAPAPGRLDQDEIRKAQEAIRREERGRMVQILANSDARVAEIERRIEEQERETDKIIANYNSLSNDEIKRLLEERIRENENK